MSLSLLEGNSTVDRPHVQQLLTSTSLPSPRLVSHYFHQSLLALRSQTSTTLDTWWVQGQLRWEPPVICIVEDDTCRTARGSASHEGELVQHEDPSWIPLQSRGQQMGRAGLMLGGDARVTSDLSSWFWLQPDLGVPLWSSLFPGVLGVPSGRAPQQLTHWLSQAAQTSVELTSMSGKELTQCLSEVWHQLPCPLFLKLLFLLHELGSRPAVTKGDTLLHTVCSHATATGEVSAHDLSHLFVVMVHWGCDLGTRGMAELLHSVALQADDLSLSSVRDTLEAIQVSSHSSGEMLSHCDVKVLIQQALAKTCGADLEECISTLWLLTCMSVKLPHPVRKSFIRRLVDLPPFTPHNLTQNHEQQAGIVDEQEGLTTFDLPPMLSRAHNHQLTDLPKSSEAEGRGWGLSDKHMHVRRAVERSQGAQQLAGVSWQDHLLFVRAVGVLCQHKHPRVMRVMQKLTSWAVRQLPAPPHTCWCYMAIIMGRLSGDTLKVLEEKSFRRDLSLVVQSAGLSVGCCTAAEVVMLMEAAEKLNLLVMNDKQRQCGMAHMDGEGARSGRGNPGIFVAGGPAAEGSSGPGCGADGVKDCRQEVGQLMASLLTHAASHLEGLVAPFGQIWSSRVNHDSLAHDVDMKVATFFHRTFTATELQAGLLTLTVQLQEELGREVVVVDDVRRHMCQLVPRFHELGSSSLVKLVSMWTANPSLWDVATFRTMQAACYCRLSFLSVPQLYQLWGGLVRAGVGLENVFLKEVVEVAEVRLRHAPSQYTSVITHLRDMPWGEEVARPWLSLLRECALIHLPQLSCHQIIGVACKLVRLGVQWREDELWVIGEKVRAEMNTLSCELLCSWVRLLSQCQVQVLGQPARQLIRCITRRMPSSYGGALEVLQVVAQLQTCSTGAMSYLIAHALQVVLAHFEVVTQEDLLPLMVALGKLDFSSRWPSVHAQPGEQFLAKLRCRLDTQSRLNMFTSLQVQYRVAEERDRLPLLWVVIKHDLGPKDDTWWSGALQHLLPHLRQLPLHACSHLMRDLHEKCPSPRLAKHLLRGLWWRCIRGNYRLGDSHGVFLTFDQMHEVMGSASMSRLVRNTLVEPLTSLSGGVSGQRLGGVGESWRSCTWGNSTLGINSGPGSPSDQLQVNEQQYLGHINPLNPPPVGSTPFPREVLQSLLQLARNEEFLTEVIHHTLVKLPPSEAARLMRICHQWDLPVSGAVLAQVKEEVMQAVRQGLLGASGLIDILVVAQWDFEEAVASWRGLGLPAVLANPCGASTGLMSAINSARHSHDRHTAMVRDMPAIHARLSSGCSWTMPTVLKRQVMQHRRVVALCWARLRPYLNELDAWQLEELVKVVNLSGFKLTNSDVRQVIAVLEVHMP